MLESCVYASVQGDVIKEGQIIGFLDQFGTELPVRVSLSGNPFCYLSVIRVIFGDHLFFF